MLHGKRSGAPGPGLRQHVNYILLPPASNVLWKRESSEPEFEDEDPQVLFDGSQRTTSRYDDNNPSQVVAPMLDSCCFGFSNAADFPTKPESKNAATQTGGKCSRNALIQTRWEPIFRLATINPLPLSAMQAEAEGPPQEIQL